MDQYSNPSLLCDRPQQMVNTQLTLPPCSSPSLRGKLTLNTVELIDGHAGQVLVDGEIVWQSQPYDSPIDARDAAKYRIAKRLRKLLG